MTDLTPEEEEAIKHLARLTAIACINHVNRDQHEKNKKALNGTDTRRSDGLDFHGRADRFFPIDTSFFNIKSN